MTNNDPTMDLINALNRADPSEWGKIVYSMPIFVEHDGYEVEDGQEKKLVVVPKGETPPANGKRLYTVDRARLEAITAEINRNYAESGKPIKLFIGHSDPKQPQKNQPDLAGFGRAAYMGTFGPKNRVCIHTDAFYKHGHENDAAEYPERSPEFLPRTNAITGVALLKTDPRLPMGMLAFSDDHEVIYYGAGFMADKPEEKEDKKPAEKPAPAPKPAAKPAPDKDGDGVPDEIDDDKDGDGIPNEQDADADGNGVADANEGEQSPAAKPQPFAPHEIAFADRMMAHLEQNHPAIKHLVGEYKKYSDTQAAMAQPAAKPAAAGATNGNLPGDKKKKPADDDGERKPKFSARIDMADTTTTPNPEIEQLKAQLAESNKRTAALEEANAILYANEALDTLERQGKVIKDRPKEIAKLVKMSTLEERQAHLQDIKINYADAERSPARLASWLPIDDGHVEGAEETEAVRVPETAEMLRYAEEHKIDMGTEAGVAQVMKALMTPPKKTAAA